MIIGEYEETVEIIPEHDPVPKPVDDQGPPEIAPPVQDGESEGTWAS